MCETFSVILRPWQCGSQMLQAYLRMNLIQKGLNPERHSIQKLLKHATRHEAAQRAFETEQKSQILGRDHKSKTWSTQATVGRKYKADKRSEEIDDESASLYDASESNSQDNENSESEDVDSEEDSFDDTVPGPSKVNYTCQSNSSGSTDEQSPSEDSSEDDSDGDYYVGAMRVIDSDRDHRLEGGRSRSWSWERPADEFVMQKSKGGRLYPTIHDVLLERGNFPTYSSGVLTSRNYRDLTETQQLVPAPIYRQEASQRGGGKNLAEDAGDKWEHVASPPQG
ncbi:hypothetical protein K438DRAFT_1760090 [Mycena galopus ATCC 62051]|nr:hypothetical protein K438DRAFT_1760090 [Mycena galopus ATCC 62051]